MQKKLYLLIVLTILLGTSNIYAHKERTHQYIIRSAYFLLKKQLGMPIPILDDFIGLLGIDTYVTLDAFLTNPVPPNDPTFDSPRPMITAGAYSEDVYDLVYGPADQLINIADLTIESPWISHTHFWDADKGINKNDHIKA